MSEYGTRVDSARDRLGEKFVSIEEASELPGCEYGSVELFEFERDFPDLQALNMCTERGCVLLPGPARAVSLRVLEKLRRDELFPDLEVPWYERQRFAAEETVRPAWYAIRTVPVPYTVGKTLSAQLGMLPASEVVPTAVELLWAMGMLRALRGMYMLPGKLVRTASVGGEGNPVTVGVYGERGVIVSNRYPAEAVFREDVGIISMLRF